MEVGTVTVDEKQAASGQPDESGKEQPKAPQQQDGAKSKDAKPATERKKTRNLSERDKRFQALQRHGKPAARRRDRPPYRCSGRRGQDSTLCRWRSVLPASRECSRSGCVCGAAHLLSLVDQHLVELLVMIDALKRASAARITVVVPYYGYARQDRKDRPRVAISAKLIADLLTTAGANRALFVDLHAAQRFRASSTSRSIICSPARYS